MPHGLPNENLKERSQEDENHTEEISVYPQETEEARKSTKKKRLRQKKKTVKEPAEKRVGLSEGETDQWLRLFGIEQ